MTKKSSDFSKNLKKIVKKKLCILPPHTQENIEIIAPLVLLFLHKSSVTNVNKLPVTNFADSFYSKVYPLDDRKRFSSKKIKKAGLAYIYWFYYRFGYLRLG